MTRTWPFLSALLLLLAVGGAFYGLSLEAGGDAEWNEAYYWRAARFTVLQAGLSALLATGLAIPVARALARRGDFMGRDLLLRLFALPLVLPTLAAVLGIVSVFGANGWINRALDAAGMGARVPLYGLTGILVAHVFFNMPLAVRLLLKVWSAVPGETWRLSAQLGMDGNAIFRRIEWPLVRRHAPGVAGLVFLLCATSFTPVLALGGGPAATTLEVAIYQSLRFDFAPDRAAVLAVLQLVLCIAALMAWQALARPMPAAPTSGRGDIRPDRAGTAWRDGAWIALAAMFVAAPLLSLLLDGVGPALLRVLGEAAMWRAMALSTAIAAMTALLSLAISAGLLLGTRHLRRTAPRAAMPFLSLGLVALVVPPFVLGTGWFILLRGTGDPLRFGIAVIVAINALMTLPYVVRALDPALAGTEERYGRLSASLGVDGWHRFRLVDWPALRHPLGLALGLCLALSLGDLGAVALFGGGDTATLPLMLYQRMGSYRIDEAAALALVLAALCLGLFTLSEKIVGGPGDN